MKGDFIVKLPKGYVLFFDRHCANIEYTNFRQWAYIFSEAGWKEFWSTFEDVELITCGPYV